jgi:hypothetical protein
VDSEGHRRVLEGKYMLTLGGAQPQETAAKSETSFSVTGELGLLK